MVSPITIPANRMPVPTWNRLQANEAKVVIPAATEVPEPESVVFDVPKGIGLGWFERTIDDDDHYEEGDLVLVGLFDQTYEAIESAGDWEDGIGEQMADWMHNMSTRRLCVRIPDNVKMSEPIVVHVSAEDGAATLACVGVIVGAGSKARVCIHIDAAHDGVGVAGATTRIIAAEGADVTLESVQTLSKRYKHLDNVGAFLAAGAHLEVKHTVLGAAESFIGMACNLVGDESSCHVDTRYLGFDAQEIDFNYVMRQRGRQTNCELLANGVLTDSSSKILRGTIDLVHGCSGSVGNEQETVLLLNDEVRNKTIPVILCDEDDVQGAHGATIGHVNPEQLAYLQSRGLTDQQVEELFVSAAFDFAADNAFSPEVHDAVERLRKQALGYPHIPFI